MTALDRIAELAKKATPGPWRVERAGNDEIGIVRTIETVRGTEVAIATTGAVPDEVEVRNAAYIAALSPEFVLTMVACIRAAKGMRSAWCAAPPGSYGIRREIEYFDDALSKLEQMK